MLGEYYKSKKCHKSKNKSAIYGEFIRTFTFSGQAQLPIVQPGGSLVFPIPTISSKGVKYIEEQDKIGLLVPQGNYLLSWVINPNTGANVSVLVNGIQPVTNTGYNYTQSIITEGPLDVEYLIYAPLKHDNLISIVNSGTSLFSLNNIPNTQLGNTANITHVRIIRIN